MKTAAFLYAQRLADFDYGDDHPFKPLRAANTLELCRRHGLTAAAGVRLLEPPPAEPGWLELFHDADYLRVLERAGAGAAGPEELLAHGLGSDECPALPDVYDFCLGVAGATVHACEWVADGRFQRAFNPVGGFHHAGRAHAEGFCYVNDVGVALSLLLARGLRVAFVDLDAHHPNGVQDAFYEDDRALVVSLHEAGETLYPWGGFETEIGAGRGLGFNANVPLLGGTDDEVYLSAFRRVVPPLLEAFRPDLVLAEVGADTQLSDPLTHLRLTNNGYSAALRELCRASPALVAVGGGGYDVFRTARCWTLAWSALTELEPEDDYAGLVGGAIHGADMQSLFDRPRPASGEARERAQAQADRVVAYLHRNVFPIVGARPP